MVCTGDGVNVVEIFASTFGHTFKTTPINQVFFFFLIKTKDDILLLNSFSFSMGYEFRRGISTQCISSLILQHPGDSL